MTDRHDELLELEYLFALEPIHPPKPHRPLLHAAQAVVIMLVIAVLGVSSVGWLLDWPQPQPPAEHQPATVTTGGQP